MLNVLSGNVKRFFKQMQKSSMREFLFINLLTKKKSSKIFSFESAIYQSQLTVKRNEEVFFAFDSSLASKFKILRGDVMKF